jgi:hypothetical protein
MSFHIMDEFNLGYQSPHPPTPELDKEAAELLKHWTPPKETMLVTKTSTPATPDYRAAPIKLLPFDAGALDPVLFKNYQVALRTSAQLESVEIPPRDKLLGDWLREGDLGFIYGERGIGKTWLVCAIATCVSADLDLDSWQAHGSFPVLYIDGEMPLDLTRDRLKGLSLGNRHLSVLHHEVLFTTSELAINVASTNIQRVITELCTTGGFKLLILDNLSCLASGMKENDADEWEKLLMWLLELRRRRIAVIIVHHSGRSGLMRGTTKREDSAAWVIKVDQSSDDPEDATAKFTSDFEKKPRSITHAEWIRSWTFKTEHNSSVSFSCEEKSNEGKVLELIQNGLASATDIALELGLTKGTISKLAKRLQNKKLIDINGRNYTPRGFMKT